MAAQRDNLLKQCSCNPPRWPKCRHSWHLATRYEGKRYSISLDVYCKRRGIDRVRTRGNAEQLSERIVREIERGTYQERPVPVAHVPESLPNGIETGLTFDQAWPKFVDGVLGDIESLGDEKSATESFQQSTCPMSVASAP